MRTYKITYKCTGSQRLDHISIFESDTLHGKRVSNIIDAIELFEEIAKHWGTYENKNAITKIEVLEIK